MFKAIFKVLFWLAFYGGMSFAIYTYWLQPKFGPRPKTQAEERVWNIRATTAAPMDFTLKRIVRAKVEADKIRSLRFRTAGCISDMPQVFQPGDVIAGGDGIAKLDARKLNIALQEAQSRLTLYRARLQEAEASLSVQEKLVARTQNAVAKESETLDRQHNLFERKLLSLKSLEASEKKHQAAQDTLSAALDALQLHQAEIKLRETELTIQKAHLERAQLDLDDVALVAPADMVVTAMPVRAGDCVTETTTIVEGYNSGSLRLRAEVPRLLIDVMSQSGPVVGRAVDLAANPAPCTTQITSVEVDTQQDTDVALLLDMPQDCSLTFDRGQNLMLHVPMGNLRGVIRLPISAEKERNTVFIVSGDRLEPQSVEIAARDERWIYVKSGIAGGSQIMTSAGDFAMDGLKVRVISP